MLDRGVGLGLIGCGHQLRITCVGEEMCVTVFANCVLEFSTSFACQKEVCLSGALDCIACCRIVDHSVQPRLEFFSDGFKAFAWEDVVSPT